MSRQPRLDYNQQIIAADTKFNKYRAAANVVGSTQGNVFRKNYLKRRIQLLSGTFHHPDEGGNVIDDCECCEETSKDDARKNANYLQIRTQLVRQKMKTQGHSDLHSTKSFSVTTGETRANVGRVKPLGSKPGQLSSEAYDFHGFHYLSDLHQSSVTQLMFLHNSDTALVASSLDGSLSLHTLDTDPPGLGVTMRGHRAGVTDFDISVSNELLVSCDKAGDMILWHLPHGSLVRTMSSQSPLSSCKFLPGNNNLVVSGSCGGNVTVTNTSTGMDVSSSTVPGSVTCLGVSSQDNVIWAGTDKAMVLSFKVETSGKLTKCHRMVTQGASHGGVVTSLVSRPSCSGQTMLLANVGHNTLLLYTVTDNLGSLSLHSQYSVVHSSLPVRSTFAPLLSFRSGECVVSASEDGGVYFFDIARQSRSCINKLQAHSCPALAVAFNSNESYLATSDQSGLVIVWKR